MISTYITVEDNCIEVNGFRLVPCESSNHWMVFPRYGNSETYLEFGLLEWAVSYCKQNSSEASEIYLGLSIENLKQAIGSFGAPSIRQALLKTSINCFEKYCESINTKAEKDPYNEPTCGANVAQNLQDVLNFLNGLRDGHSEINITNVSDTLWVLHKMVLRTKESE